MALMPSEARNRFGKPLNAVVGETLNWTLLGQFNNRQALTDYLYCEVQALPFHNVEPHPAVFSQS